MKYYVDILLNPSAGMRENLLLNKVYTEFHKLLCDLEATDIGVSFPEYRVKLGRVFRIHGTQERLAVLLRRNWLGEIKQYCYVSDIKPVPAENVKYRTVSRKQANMTMSKLRRLAKRKSLSVKEMKDYKAKMFSQGLSLPYLELESASTGKKYRHFIDFGDLSDVCEKGSFNQFGLSKLATVPWF